MDPMLAVKLVQVHNLTDVMIAALRTGTLAEAVRCAPRQLGALTGRGLVDSESHTLTLLGDLLVRAFSGADLTDEERREALTSIASGASTRGGGFVVDTSGIDSDQDPEMARAAVLWAIRPARDGEDGVLWSVAKRQVKEFFARRRDFDKVGVKASESLTKRDVLDVQQVQSSESLTKRDVLDVQQVQSFPDEPQEETLFQAPVA